MEKHFQTCKVLYFSLTIKIVLIFVDYASCLGLFQMADILFVCLFICLFICSIFIAAPLNQMTFGVFLKHSSVDISWRATRTSSLFLPKPISLNFPHFDQSNPGPLLSENLPHWMKDYLNKGVGDPYIYWGFLYDNNTFRPSVAHVAQKSCTCWMVSILCNWFIENRVS